MGLKNDNVQVEGEFTLDAVLGELNPDFREIIRRQIKDKNSGKDSEAVAQVIPLHFATALKKVDICLSELRELYKNKKESETSFMKYVEWTAADIIALKIKSMINKKEPQKSYEPRLSGHVGPSSFDDQTYIDFLEKLQSIQTSAEYRGHGRYLLARLLNALSVITSIACSGTKLKGMSERQDRKSKQLYALRNNVFSFYQATVNFNTQPSSQPSKLLKP